MYSIIILLALVTYTLCRCYCSCLALLFLLLLFLLCIIIIILRACINSSEKRPECSKEGTNAVCLPYYCSGMPGGETKLVEMGWPKTRWAGPLKVYEIATVNTQSKQKQRHKKVEIKVKRQRRKGCGRVRLLVSPTNRKGLTHTQRLPATKDSSGVQLCAFQPWLKEMQTFMVEKWASRE